MYKKYLFIIILYPYVCNVNIEQKPRDKCSLLSYHTQTHANSLVTFSEFTLSVKQQRYYFIFCSHFSITQKTYCINFHCGFIHTEKQVLRILFILLFNK